MNEEYKTLRELDVQPGDVVEWKSGRKYTIFGWRGGECYSRADDGSREPGDLAADQKGWRIVSREFETPKLWRDMTPEEKGALLLAHHEGKVIEWLPERKWIKCAVPGFTDFYAYRVRPEPKREVERVKIVNTDGMAIGIGTVVCENGKPDCDSIKMEPL